MKKTIYILVSILLGLLLSFILHGLFELAVIKAAFSQGKAIEGTYFLGVGWCALPVWVQYTFPLLGIVGGYFLGQHWWRVVYIEKSHWWFRRQRMRKNI